MCTVRRVLLLMLPLLLLGASSTWARSLDGVVREAGTRRVVPGAVVTLLVDDDIRKTLPLVEDEYGMQTDGTEQWTDEEGGFHLDLPDVMNGLKVLKVRVEAAGYITVIEDVDNDLSRSIALDVYIERSNDDVATVVRERRSPANRARGSHRIDDNEVNEMPGTYSDPAKAIENFPGMGRVLRSQGSLLVRGANPEDSAVYVDDYEVPDLYHFTGSTSVINIPFIESVELVPGAFSARFGRATGGLLNLKTRRLPTDDIHGFAKFDIIDGGAYVGIPISDKAAVGASARRSWVDVLRGAQVLMGNANDEITLIPTYWDYQLKLDWDVAPGHSLVGFVFGSGDRELYIRPGSDNTAPYRRDRNTDFHRASLRYENSFGGGFRNALTVVGGWEVRTDDENNGIAFLERNTYDVQVRDEVRYTTNDTKITFGVDATARADALVFGGNNAALFTRGLPIVDIEGSGRARRSEDFLTRATFALYAEGDFMPMKGLLLTPGLRLDGYLLDGQPDLSIEPRFAGSYRALSGDYGLLLKVGGGVFARPPNPEDVSLARAYGETIGLARAYHLQTGIEQELGPGRALTATLFGVARSDQVRRSPDYPASTTFGESPVVANSAGVSMGAEFLLRAAKAKRYFAWVAYAISKHENWDGPGPHRQEGLYPSAFDTTHLLTLVGQLHLWWGFRVGARYRLASGMPNTAIVQATLDADSGRFIPQYGQAGGERFPPFMALDVRIDWTYVLPWAEIDLYADLVNALNLQPQEGWLYNFDYSQRQPLLGLPLIPSVGFKATF